MNIKTIELGKDDIVLVKHCIGTMQPSEVDSYCDKIVKLLASVFGKEKVALFPVRTGEEWDFTIIRKV